MITQTREVGKKQEPRSGASNRTRAIMKAANAVVVIVLRSPLHRVLSGTVLLLTFTGRKSGNTYTTPVTYLSKNGELWVYTSSPWWKNLRGGAPVHALVKGRVLEGTADVVTSAEEVAYGIQTFLDLKGSKSAGQIGLSIDTSRQPTREELIALARNRVIVRISV